MSDGILKERGKSLEEQFFARRDAQLVEELKERQRAEDARDSLASALGIDGQSVPDELIALGLAPEEITAFSLVPLVVVGWADGHLDDKERRAILAAAAQAGIDAESAPYRLLVRWLDQQPPDTLIAAWRSYVSALCGSLSPEARQELQRDVVGRARRVAEAVGGLLGLGGKVSVREKRALQDIESAFEHRSA
jgi:hypothetical protein